MTSLTTTPITADLLHGAVELEPTVRGVRLHRLPAWARAQCPDPQLLIVESQPSGVRLAVRTTATALELDTIPTKRVYAGAPPRPDGVYDLVVDGKLVEQATVAGGDVQTIDLATGRAELAEGSPGTLHFELPPGGVRRVEVWLPHDETTELVALRSDAPLDVVPTGERPRWLHHGSSVSHGSNATHPSGTWPAVAAARAGLDLVNLGLGGSALLDPFVARTMRDTSADLVSVKLGLNVVNTDLMRLRAFGPAVHGFLDTIREGHPETPLLVISPILCPIHEETPGPTGFDTSAMATGQLRFLATGDPADVSAGKLTLRVVREELARIVAQRSETDPHLHLLDGRELYGESDAVDLPLPDALHPGPETHRVMGERFALHVSELTAGAGTPPTQGRF